MFSLNNRRILFAYFSLPVWVSHRRRKTICEAAADLKYDLFVVGENYADLNQQNYSNLMRNEYLLCLDVFRAQYEFHRRTVNKENPDDFAEDVFRELTFWPSANSMGNNHGAILKRLQGWFNEASIIYKLVQPDIIIVWNGTHGMMRMYAKAAKMLNIPVFYAERGLLPDSWFMDSRGVGYFSSLVKNEEWKKIADTSTIRSKISKYMTIGASQWDQPGLKDGLFWRRKLGIDSRKKVIFFPLQIDTDTNIILFSKYFKNNYEVLKWLTDELPPEEFYLLVKPHPKGRDNVKRYESMLKSRGELISDINILDAISLADCVLSINSTVAFEAAIYGKPVFLLGQGILNNKEFVGHYVQQEKAVTQINRCIQNYNLDHDYLSQQALKFAGYLDKECYMFNDDLVSTKKQFKLFDLLHKEQSNKFFSAQEIITLTPRLGLFFYLSHWIMNSIKSISRPGRILFKNHNKSIGEKKSDERFDELI